MLYFLRSKPPDQYPERLSPLPESPDSAPEDLHQTAPPDNHPHNNKLQNPEIYKDSQGTASPDPASAFFPYVPPDLPPCE